MEEFRKTINNLFELVKLDIISNDVVLLYIYYFSNITKPCSFINIKKNLRVSNASVMYLNKVLKELKLVILIKKKGYASVVERVFSFSNKKLNIILENEKLIEKLSGLKDVRFDKRFLKNRSTDLSNRSNEINILISLLPVKLKFFHVTQKSIDDLRILSKRLDFKEYVKWFIQKKINTGLISNFNMNIFLYPTMITEFESFYRGYSKQQIRLKISQKTFKNKNLKDDFNEIEKRSK